MRLQWQGIVRKHYVAAALLFLLSAFFIMGPLLAPGFVLTLDMVFGPQIQLPAYGSASWLFYAILWLLHFFVPVDVEQKILLMGICWAAGFGMYCLVLTLRSRYHDITWILAAIIAGLFYVVNPFVFTRFMVGQFAVLAGYALLPWAVRAGLYFFTAPNPKAALLLALWLTAVAVVSIHTLPLACIVLTGIGLASAWRKRTQLKQYGKKILSSSAYFIGVFIVFNSYWLVPIVANTGFLVESSGGFSAADRQAFSTVADSLFGLVGNVAALYGFWADNYSLYVLPKDELAWWWLPIIPLWLLILWGGYCFWLRARGLALVFIISGMIGLIVSLGYKGHLLAPALTWLAEHAPFGGGYREPQKFVMLVALSYAIFLAFGVAGLLELVRARLFRIGLIAAVVILIVSYTPGMFWGFGGQLQAVQYPSSWYAMNNRLKNDKQQYRILFLPWHHYMPYRFVGRTIAPPAPKFFEMAVVVSDQPELGKLRPYVFNPETSHITQLLSKARLRDDFGKQLKTYNIKYVLLAKEYDSNRYAFLRQQKDLRLVESSADFELYKSTVWSPR